MSFNSWPWSVVLSWGELSPRGHLVVTSWRRGGGRGHVHGILRVEAGYTARQKHLTPHRTVPATTNNDPAPNVSRADVEKPCARGRGTKLGAQIGIWTLVEMLRRAEEFASKGIVSKGKPLWALKSITCPIPFIIRMVFGAFGAAISCRHSFFPPPTFKHNLLSPAKAQGSSHP